MVGETDAVGLEEAMINLLRWLFGGRYRRAVRAHLERALKGR